MNKICRSSLYVLVAITYPLVTASTAFAQANATVPPAPGLEKFTEFLAFAAKSLRQTAYGLAVAVIIYAGILYFTAYGDESKPTQAKNLLKGVAIGLLFIVLAEVIVLALLRGVSSPSNTASQQAAIQAVFH